MMTLTVKESRRKYRPEIRQDVLNCCELTELKSVQWHVKGMASGDVRFPDIDFPDWVHVLFTDKDGRTAELCTGCMNTEMTRMDRITAERIIKSDISALNKVLNHFNLLPGGKIIGINWTINQAVNYARKQYPGLKLFCDDGQMVL